MREEGTHLERQGFNGSEEGRHSPGRAGAGPLAHSPLHAAAVREEDNHSPRKAGTLRQ